MAHYILWKLSKLGALLHCYIATAAAAAAAAQLRATDCSATGVMKRCSPCAASSGLQIVWSVDSMACR
jgi:hypothetical protein